MIRAAKAEEHQRILALAKQSHHTKDFGHMMFSGEAMHDRGWIRVMELEDGEFAGFTCVRHKVRAPETSLYYIGVDPKFKHQGVGTKLLEDLKAQCPSPRIVLNVAKDNDEALHFYDKHGFKNEGESVKGKCWQLALEW